MSESYFYTSCFEIYYLNTFLHNHIIVCKYFDVRFFSERGRFCSIYAERKIVCVSLDASINIQSTEHNLR
jgi:hypothetical protein